MLRAHPWVVEANAFRRGVLFVILLVFGSFYGAVMGAYALNPTQMAYSALKSPFLVLASFFLSLPSYFVVSTLLGLRDDFGSSIQALLAAQASFSIALASLAPLTAFLYWSGVDYDTAVVVNGVMFLAACLAAQRVLSRLYAPLIARDSRHRVALYCWITMYCFVAIQMAWILRPFIGAPDLPPTFFRGTDLGNAYVAIARAIWRLFAD